MFSRASLKLLIGHFSVLCGRAKPSHTSASQAAMREILNIELDSILKAGIWKHERIITTPQDNLVKVQGREGKILNFCANNYLGLSSHPQVIAAGKKAFESHGGGLSSARFICGTQDIHKDLERKLARFHNREDAILYASCFDANAGFFEILLGPDDVVLSDELNHASIINGIRLCKAKRMRYKHMDMEDLERQLEAVNDCRMRMIVSDGVFSMNGNVTPLPAICQLADKYNALVFLDESHATGLFGDTGRGTEEYFKLDGRVDFINSSLGKALGGAAGGYTTGPKEAIDLLRNRSRPYLFSNTLPPPVVACASKVMDILMESSYLPNKLMKNTMLFRGKMQDAGFSVEGSKDHPICSIMLGDAKLAAVFAEDMLGKARIRVQISATHSNEDIDRLVNAFVKVGRKCKVIE